MNLFLFFHLCELEANRSQMRSFCVMKWITGEHPAERLRSRLLLRRIISSNWTRRYFLEPATNCVRLRAAVNCSRRKASGLSDEHFCGFTPSVACQSRASTAPEPRPAQASHRAAVLTAVSLFQSSEETRVCGGSRLETGLLRTRLATQAEEHSQGLRLP